ncbi:MAG: putative N6-adenine-specific DNA methylase [Luteibaculaceae bacterium]|jgi:putative N6-adenine-specific DNA methylase
MRTFIATTLEGLESALGEELKELGAQHCFALKRAVRFDAEISELDTIVSYSRLTLKFLLPLLEFEIQKGDQLYAKSKAFEWGDWLTPQSTFCIDSTVKSTLYQHTKYPSMLLKDAIVDTIREQTGERPSIDIENPDVRVTLQIFENKVRILADLAGKPLFKRGYRRYSGEAPLNEVLAAGLIRLSGWSPQRDSFFDPMTGSGTLVAEAALKAQDIPHTKPRDGWAFQKWAGFESKRKRADEVPNNKVFIGGADMLAARVKDAQRNLEIAGLYDIPTVEVANFFSDDAPTCPPGVMIINPPYDERMELDEDEAFYGRIGDTIKHKYKGWKVWVFSANKQAMKNIGLKTSKRLNLKNGPLECRFYCYEVY